MRGDGKDDKRPESNAGDVTSGRNVRLNRLREERNAGDGGGALTEDGHQVMIDESVSPISLNVS